MQRNARRNTKHRKYRDSKPQVGQAEKEKEARHRRRSIKEQEAEEGRRQERAKEAIEDMANIECTSMYMTAEERGRSLIGKMGYKGEEG